MNNWVHSLTVFGGDLIAGGTFTTAGSAPAVRIAAWDGSSWTNLGSGADGPVYGLTVYDDQLFAGGSFTTAGGTSANRIAAWNGSSWSPLGTGVNYWVEDLTVYDNRLVAGGQFTIAGGKISAYVATWEEIATGIDGGGDVTAYSVELVQNHPNPFNPSTMISFSLSTRAQIRLSIYDVQGKLVIHLVEGVLGEGVHKAVWNGKDMRGNPVTSGLYFYRLRTGDATLSKKMLLLK